MDSLRKRKRRGEAQSWYGCERRSNKDLLRRDSALELLNSKSYDFIEAESIYIYIPKTDAKKVRVGELSWERATRDGHPTSRVLVAC